MLRFKNVAPLLFASGGCSLLYQTAWLRELRLVFGASTAASAAVLAIFIGGLGVGGVVLGARADRHPRPLLLYAHLEALIAAAAAVTPLSIGVVRALYVWVGGTEVLGLAAGTVVRLLLSALVLGPPTFLMGGTLSAVARAVQSDQDRSRREVALLYGVNTLGAVVGCLVGTFLLFEVLGTRRTLWVACLLNALVALLARGTALRLDPAPAAEATRPDETEPPAAPLWIVCLAAGGAGFVFFLMELVWYRMLGPVLGGTVFTFGLILALALLGIGLGGLAYGLGRARPATLTGFAYICLAEAICVAFPFALGDRIAFVTVLLRGLGTLGFWGHVAAWSAVTALVVVPAAFVSGVQFPQLIALAGRGRRQVGRDVGLVYAANTAGAIAGSLAGGFGLLPALTAPGCWRLSAWVLLALAALGAVMALRRGGRRRTVPALALAAALALLSRADGPTAVWRHSSIGVGRIPPSATTSANALEDWAEATRRSLLWEAEGVESSVGLVAINGLAFVVNGKVDGNARNDAPTQVMSGLLGALLHPDPRRAMVIGLGTGSTAGWLGAVPSIEQVDVVELEPAVLEVARASAAVNRDVLSNRKVHIRIADAREALLTSRVGYDVIFSEPSNPYRAGIASLFTRDFYRAASSRLREGGLFLQWMQAYEIDGATLRGVYATLTSVFPSVEIWRTKNHDLLFVAGGNRGPRSLAALRARVAQEPYRTALAVTWRVTDVEGVLARHVASPALARLLDPDEIGRANTDDLNLLEFGFARGVSGAGSIDVDEIRETAAGLKGRWPRLDGPVDWDRVQDDEVAVATSQGVAPRAASWSGPRAALARAEAAYIAGDLAGTLREWQPLGREPRNLTELSMVAEAMAEAGLPASTEYAEALRPWQPIEADLVSARLHRRRGEDAEAAALLEGAFVRHRSDPWPAPFVVKRGLTLARELVDAHPELGPRLVAALSQPFAVMILEEERREASVAIALAGSYRDCPAAFAAYEPHVPWRGKFLARRRECYIARRHPLAGRAVADLARFTRSEPVPPFAP